MNKHDMLNEILLPTMGVLLYSEQLFKICTSILGLNIEQADNIRKIYGKQDAKGMEETEEMITSICQDSRLSDNILFQLEENCRNLKSKLFIDMQEKIYYHTLQSILGISYGKLSYQFQIYEILTKIVGLSEDVAQGVIEDNNSDELNAIINAHLYEYPLISSALKETFVEFHNVKPLSWHMVGVINQ